MGQTVSVWAGLGWQAHVGVEVGAWVHVDAFFIVEQRNRASPSLGAV